MGRSPRRWLLLRRWRHDLAPRHDARWRRSGGPADADIGAACVLLRSLQFGDIGGELVQALPHDSETVRDRSELIARSGEGRARLGRRDGRSRRGQPLKPWGQLGKRSPGRIAVGLPDQSGSNTDPGRDQKAGEGEQGAFDAPGPRGPEQLQFGLGEEAVRAAARWPSGLRRTGTLRRFAWSSSASRPPA